MLWSLILPVQHSGSVEGDSSRDHPLSKPDKQ